MKKIVLLFVCYLAISTTNFAQTNDDVQKQRTISFEQMALAAKEIGLNEKQTVKLKEIFQEFFKNQDEIKADTTLTTEQRKTKLTKVNEKKDWKVQNLLGDKYKEYGLARKRIAAEAAAKKPE